MQAGGERPMEKAQDLKNSQAEGWTVDCNYGVFSTGGSYHPTLGQ